jgi:hypothetical protein
MAEIVQRRWDNWPHLHLLKHWICPLFFGSLT